MEGKKSILIEGWRFLPHSYAVVNSFHLLELSKRDDVEVFHHDVPLFLRDWQHVRGLMSEAQENAIAAVGELPPGRTADVTLRMTFPYDLRPAAGERLFVFGTAEMGCVPGEFMVGGRPFREALAENPGVSIITPSKWSKEGFVRSGARAEQVFVVPHGVDVSIFHPLTEDERAAARKENNWQGFIFLSVGAMTQNKGLIPLLKAFAAVASRYPRDVQLVMKGMDALYRSKDMLLEQTQGLTEAEKRIIEPRLHYRGETLPFAEMALMYQMADAYVSPYYSEGFNMPVLEAAACGVPVICTAGGSTDDFTRDTFAARIAAMVKTVQVGDVEGRVVVPNVESLIGHMMGVVENAGVRAQTRVSGPAFVGEHFTWKHAVDRLVDVMFPHP